jgi:hypothetical protein
MIGLDFLIGALALLVTLLLFGFVGCDLVFGLDPPDPCEGDYHEVVKATTDLVAYWRLGEPAATPVPSSGGAAKDEVGGFHGDYFKLNPVPNPDNLRHSPATTGSIILGITPGLLELEPQDAFPCVQTDGGYVQVPFDDQLNPPQFTLEAWVSPDPFLDPRFFYCLVESTGPAVPGLLGKKTGWGLFLGPSEINNPNPAGPLFWQVWMGDGNQFKRVAIAKPDFPTPGFSHLRLTYLVLTFDGIANLQLFLYFPNTEQELTFEALQALTPPSSIIFHRNDASTAGQGDFFIGTGSNLTILGAPQRLYPFKGKIQEVALYKRDLSAPNNAGIQSTLRCHETAGGNL